MIFNEIYSAYYNTVAKIIASIINGNADEKTINKIIDENAFGESMLTVLPSLKGEKWQLVKADMTTPIQRIPTMPLTTIQKQWLKSISLDPRIKLFGIEFDGLDDVEPLFTSEDYCFYDKYMDGDPYEDEAYIERFRTILSALNEKRPLKIQMVNRKGNIVSMTVMPQHLEYSEKDDKFRLVTAGRRAVATVNLAKIMRCSHYKGEKQLISHERDVKYDTVTVKLLDERNALERFMLHFAHFEKQVEKLNRKHYLIRIKYAHDDEPEMVIRILSFGPLVEVIESEDFRNLVIEKLKNQKNCGLR